MKALALCLLLVPVAACSTYVQNRASDRYAPVYPVQPAARDAGLPTGGIYTEGAPGLFATDRRAAHVGDILTVAFTERFAATKSQDAAATKTDSYSYTIPGVLSPINGANLTGGTNQKFAGKGSAAQSNSFTGRMSVNVVRVMPGGNLEILGQKKLTLNNGDEYVRLSGIVRPEDISADNVVMSDRIADADIKYIGAGQIADAGKEGWFHRLLNTVAPN